MTDADMNAVMCDWELPRVNPSAGIDPRWLQAFLAIRIADLLAQIALGDRLHQLPPEDRAWLKAAGENVVQDAVTRYDVLLLEAGGTEDQAMDRWRKRDEPI